MGGLGIITNARSLYPLVAHLCFTYFRLFLYPVVLQSVYFREDQGVIRPFRVSGSYSTPDVDMFERRRSIQDRAAPLSNVQRAGMPGCFPLRIYQPCSLHLSISHGALLFVVVSSLFLGICISSMVGDNSPTRAFQSPQITCAVCF